MGATHRRIETREAPAAIGPYSQAIALPALGLLFTSGQIGLDPRTGEIVPGGTEAEFRQVLDNLGAVLEAAGSGFDRVVKTTLYLTDLSEFGRVNAIYAERVGTPLPARVTVGVAALPKGARIEAEVVASLREDARGEKGSH